MNKNRNYDKELELLIKKIPAGTTPTLMLHACCAPCSSYVLEYLSGHFLIKILYYNPNISPREEFDRREAELKKLLREMPMINQAQLVPFDYDSAPFFEMAKGLENEPEGSERCYRCFEMRIREAAIMGLQHKCDYFTTTLTISPMKDAVILNEIGERMAEEYGIKHLPSNFKKKDGYKRSTELSREYGLYRQDYCGCIFSKREREKQKEQMVGVGSGRVG